MNDISMIFIRTLYPYILIGLFISILLNVYYKKIIGKAGEHHVKKELKKLPKDIYYIINDLMIRVNDITYQIDHIVISVYGIFVIETKQYNGYIRGDEYSEYWYQNKKYKIHNPLRQNYGHVKALEEKLNLSNENFIPIVCIPSTAKVNVKSKSYVLRINELCDVIMSYNSQKLSNFETIYNELLNSNIIDKKERKEHVKKIKNQLSLKKESKDIVGADDTICPNCGNKLVERNGQYGTFIGCSNYPKCKYTKKKII